MKKKLTVLTMAVIMLLTSSGCSVLTQETVKKNRPKDFKVVVITDDKSANKERYTSIKTTIKKYKDDLKEQEEKETGTPERKKYVQELVLPADITKDMPSVEAKIKKLAKDKRVQAFVVSTEQVGLLPVIEKVKKERPEITTIAAPMQENANYLSEAMDVVLSMGQNERAEAMVQTAKKMGATRFIHYAKRDDLKDKNIQLRKDAIKEFCKKSGLGFAEVALSDYTDEAGKEKMKQILTENIDSQIKKFGKDINVFGASPDLDEVILEKDKQSKYIVAEQSTPDPSKTYPEVMGFKISKKHKDDYMYMSDRISEGAKRYGLSNRLAGYQKPYDVFLPAFAIDLAVEMADRDLTQEDITQKDYLEAFVEKNYGVSSEFKNYSEAMYNYQVFTIEHMVY
ncbi:MAG: DUF3798 domain-containing protein [Clostridioides sp.]|jgi:hypothetical protein|nr:DUF3798 domain-containing protein [Clostridioides sp.]